MNKFLGLFQKDRVKEVNPNMEVFDGVDDDLNIDELSVTTHAGKTSTQNGFAGLNVVDFYYEKVYSPISTNKENRLKTYRLISRYPEVLQCLEDIADDTWSSDESSKMVKLVYNEHSKLYKNDKQKNVIEQEFDAYMNLFDFDQCGFNYVRAFLSDGELAWENIIDPKKPTRGILGIRYLPAEQYEFLRDIKTNRNIGIMFRKLNMDTSLLLSSSYNSSIQSFQNIDPYSSSASYASSMLNDEVIPMLWSQLTYINTGDYNHNQTVVYPLLDRARESYYQLSMMHDAAIIMRVIRAPERLLFNIDVGKLPDKKAKEKVRKFVSSMTSKKRSTSDGDIRNKYDAHSMLEAYYFWKSSEGGGTTVETLGSTANYDQMDDVEYFLRRLYKTLKVPFSRYKQAENTMERDETISYEEYSFAKFINRIQKMFASGLMKGFITHLKLRKLWDQYKLSGQDFRIKFAEPVLFELYQQQKLLQIKIESYELIADKDELSSTLAMETILGWDEDRIARNEEMVRKEKLSEAIITYWANKLEEFGPKDIKPPIEWNEEPTDDGDPDM